MHLIISYIKMFSWIKDFLWRTSACYFRLGEDTSQESSRAFFFFTLVCLLIIVTEKINHAFDIQGGLMQATLHKENKCSHLSQSWCTGLCFICKTQRNKPKLGCTTCFLVFSSSWELALQTLLMFVYATSIRILCIYPSHGLIHKFVSVQSCQLW